MNDLEFVGDYRQPQLSARQRVHGHDGSSAGDLSFGDFLDIINPLQHIPLVSTLYREITGDEISPHARILGDTLFGGPTGFLSSVANVLYQEITGEDVGETVVAFFSGDEGDAGEPQFAGDDGTVSPAGTLPGSQPAPLETAAGAAGPDTAAPAAAAPLTEGSGTGETAAMLPEAAPGMLTGQDALNALFMDLRASRQDAAALPLAGPPAQSLPLPGRTADDAAAKSYPLPPRQIRVAAPAGPDTTTPGTETPGTEAPVTETLGAAAAEAEDPVHPLLFAQETADDALADRMMQALDKYQAMARQGAAGRREDGERQQDDRVLWQADPAAAAPAGS